MTIQDFIIEAKQDLRAYLDSIGEEDVEITDQNIVKANDTVLHGLVLKRQSSIGGPNVYLDELFERHESGEEMESLMRELRAITHYYLDCPLPPVDIISDLRLDNVKQKLTLRLLDVRRNMSYMSGRPYIDAGCGFAMTVDLCCMETEGSGWKVSVTDAMLEDMECTREEMLTAAMKNTISLEPAILMDLPEYVSTGTEHDLLAKSTVSDYTGPFILTNKSQFKGAAVLFYPDLQRRISELLQGGYYVLPISVHEVLIIPDTDDPDPQHLQQMLISGNVTVVDDEDVLSDKVLHYDHVNGCLSVVSVDPATDAAPYLHSRSA